MTPLLRYLRFAVLDRFTRAPRRKARRGPKRSRDYKAFVRTLPCCCGCGRGPSEAAHVGSDGGMSMKANDYSCVPLFWRCHIRYHQIGRRAFEREYGIVFEYVVEGVYTAWEAR